MPVETVIFLGAGASAAEGAPTQASLFTKYGALAEDLDRKPEFHEMHRELATFFDTFFGVDLDHPQGTKRSFPTFEEALGIIELAIQREEQYRGFGSGSGPTDGRLQALRQHLISLIAIILQQTEPDVRHQRLALLT